MLGPGSSIPHEPVKRKGKLAVGELRLYSTPVLLVIAESANEEVSRHALAVLKERGLDENATNKEWAIAWQSTNELLAKGDV